MLPLNCVTFLQFTLHFPYHQYVLLSPFSHSLSLLGISSVGPFRLLLFPCCFSDLTPSFWWQLGSTLLCLITMGMLIWFPAYLVSSQPAVLGLWVLLEGACGCAFCSQWPCSWVGLLFSDPRNALFFLPTLYMSSAALQQPSSACTAVFHFSDGNLHLKVVS